MRLEPSVNMLCEDLIILDDIIKLIHIVMDEEIVANGCKIIRICLRNEEVIISKIHDYRYCKELLFKMKVL